MLEKIHRILFIYQRCFYFFLETFISTSIKHFDQKSKTFMFSREYLKESNQYELQNNVYYVPTNNSGLVIIRRYSKATAPLRRTLCILAASVRFFDKIGLCFHWDTHYYMKV